MLDPRTGRRVARARTHHERLLVLLNLWLKRGCKPPAGLSERAIEALEAAMGLRLTDDLRALFRVADGSGGFDPETVLTFWSLGEIADRHNEAPDGCATFLDYNIQQMDYAIRLDGEPRGQIVEHEGPLVTRVIAPTFTGFVQRLLSEPDLLHDALPPLRSPS